MTDRTIPISLIAGGLCFFAACGNMGNERSEGSGDVVSTVGTETFSDEHHAANSLDYFGTYVGVLPCADCHNDETSVEIVIAADTTFRYSAFEAAEGDDPAVLTGKWAIDRNTITFGNVGPAFHVAENRLIPIGDDGNRYSGELAEKFSLHKLD